MPPVVIPNTAQVRITWLLSGSAFAVNVVHGQIGAGPGFVDQAQAQALANALSTRLNAMAATSKSQLQLAVTLGQVGLRTLNVANQPEFIATPSPAFAFTGSTELLPLNVALCITLRTALAGQSFRGRFYVTGYTEGASSSGVASTQATQAGVDIVNAVKAALTDANLTLAVASRTRSLSTPVTAVLARDTRWDTQRRRIVPGI